MVSAYARRVYPLGKALELAWSTGVLPAPRRRVTASFSKDRKLSLDLADSTQRTMYCGTFEHRESRLFGGLLPPGGTFVDVGAHVGWFTVLGSRCVGETGSVHAFEAFPATFSDLERNIDLNGLRNVDARHVAVRRRAGTATVGLQPDMESGGATAGPGSVGERTEVEAGTLDELIPGDQDVDLLKIDVEGGELEVLGGATGVLERTGAVLIELNESALSRNGTSADDVIDTLTRHGFTEQKQIATIGIRLGLIRGYTNLLARRPTG